MAKIHESDGFDCNDYAADDDENYYIFTVDHQLLS